MSVTQLTSLQRSTLLLVIFWLICTFYNLGKAYHIDDTAYLEIAQWIASHPLTPMSGTVNWIGIPAPIHELNQPPLYPYILAGWGTFFGYSEVAMHALQSLFTLFAIFLFHKIATIVAPRSALLLTAFFTFGPGFFVGQNLMTDVPVLMCWLGCYYSLIKIKVPSEGVRYLAASTYATAAVLIKYSSLPLLPLLLGYMIARRQYRLLPIAMIPFLALAGWSVFNYIEYGSVHILNRPQRLITLSRLSNQFTAWLLCLGALCPFSVTFFAGYVSCWRPVLRSAANLILSLSMFLGIILVALFFQGVIPTKLSDTVLRNLFLVNGALLVVLLLSALIRSLQDIRRQGYSKDSEQQIIIFYWLFSGATFIILFSPFMATRHVLLVLPALLLIVGPRFLEAASFSQKLLSVCATVVLTAGLGISDWYFADCYRTQAQAIMSSTPKSQTVWFAGHWGWQWYARLNGMKQLDRHSKQVAPGDYIVVPQNVNRQKVNSKILLTPVKEISVPGNALTYFSTREQARFYASSHWKIPWNLSRGPIGTITLYRVLENSGRVANATSTGN